MSPQTARQTERELLAGLAAKTLTRIPALNGRVEKACKLVLGGDVALHQDGTALVNSLTDPTRTYQVTGKPGQCQCQDYDRAPEHLCCHRLAVGLTRKVQALLPQSTGVETGAASQPLPFLLGFIAPWSGHSGACGRVDGGGVWRWSHWLACSTCAWTLAKSWPRKVTSTSCPCSMAFSVILTGASGKGWLAAPVSTPVD